jgi:hypothetical protein
VSQNDSPAESDGPSPRVGLDGKRYPVRPKKPAEPAREPWDLTPEEMNARDIASAWRVSHTINSSLKLGTHLFMIVCGSRLLKEEGHHVAAKELVARVDIELVRTEITHITETLDLLEGELD